MEQFELISRITDVQTIAWGHGIKILPWLMKRYGGNHLLGEKKKARLSFEFGVSYEAELHWFEAHGFGKVNMKSNTNTTMSLKDLEKKIRSRIDAGNIKV
jgi:hypothetical protein